MRYFVTGATGFIGGRVARQLIEGGHDVVAIARQPERAHDLIASGIEIRQGDIRDKQSMRGPMSRVDGVFHIAGWYKIGARDVDAAHRVNVDGTRNVLELMRELEIPKGVYTSTLAVFSNTRGFVPDESYRYTGPHISTYDRTKWIAHYRVAEPMIAAGLPLVIVQPGLTYGPGDTSAARDVFVQYLRRRLPIAPRRTAYCWAHVDDAARGHIQAMELGAPGETYIIAGPVHTLIEALDIARQITGVPVPRIHPGPALMTLMAAVDGLLERVLSLPDLYTAEALRAIAGVTYLGSNAKARRVLGFAPRALDIGLQETLAYEMRRLGVHRTA